jgi:hypothetical protein
MSLVRRRPSHTARPGMAEHLTALLLRWDGIDRVLLGNLPFPNVD